MNSCGIIFAYIAAALGYLTIIEVTEANIVLVPFGASFLEFDSTGYFFDMVHSTVQSIGEGENMVACALSREGLQFESDAVRTVIARYDVTQQAGLASLIQAYVGKPCHRTVRILPP